MSKSVTMHSKDLENVSLISIENTQPDWNCVVYDSTKEVKEEQELETCIVDDAIDYETECVINSDEVFYYNEEDSNSSTELIVPELLESRRVEVPVEIIEPNKSLAVSWPTLEILPGGVIKNAEKYNSLVENLDETEPVSNESGEMMFACAKCSKGFKYLFRLVKHVKLHEDQDKKEKEWAELTSSSNKSALQAGKKKVVSRSKTKTMIKKL